MYCVLLHGVKRKIKKKNKIEENYFIVDYV